MMGLIDLNTVDDDEAPSSDSSPSPPRLPPAPATVCMELWHACAGPLISLPKKGSVVVYFPQGQLEQSADVPAAVYDLPPHVFCRVVAVKLHAETAKDEVYAQVSLVPETQIERRLREGEAHADDEDGENEGSTKLVMPHMFCKTLTASDTSTHGGFSVPRRAAEDCFPPLDYNQQRPSQELVAKDLHGLEWKFKHIYRGQPRRHLLTTGWSAFINRKKLVCGDAVLFLRGGDGVLRLGIRRAVQVKDTPFLAPRSQQLNMNNFAAVVDSISTNSVFNIFYNPRENLSEFVIPFRKFSTSLDHSFSVGMRFKMRFESEDAAEQRYTGLVTGVGDIDPVRWPGSKWRCLMVRWDDMEAKRHNRVCPWEIEPCGSGFSNNLMFAGSKRTRNGLPSKPDFPVPNGTGGSDFGESSRFQKVLQGQEIFSFSTPGGGDGQDHQPPDPRRRFPGIESTSIAEMENCFRNSIGNSDISSSGTGFGESFRFRKVLQGQEKFSNPIYGVEAGPSRVGWSAWMQGYNTNRRSSAPAPIQVSSPSSVLMFQQASNPSANFQSIYSVNYLEEQEVSQNSFGRSDETRNLHAFGSEYQMGMDTFGLCREHGQGLIPCAPAMRPSFSHDVNLVSPFKSSCRLFGFPLTNEAGDEGVGDKHHQVKRPLNPNVSLLPRAEEPLQMAVPPGMSKAVGSSCTNISTLYSARDMLVDIPL